MSPLIENRRGLLGTSSAGRRARLATAFFAASVQCTMIASRGRL